MSWKIITDVQRIKCEVLVVGKQRPSRAMTADFVSPDTQTIKVTDGTQRAMTISLGGLDIADLNKIRLGQKPPSAETTVPPKKELTQ